MSVAPTRCRLRTKKDAVSGNGPIVYFMRKDIRANDNWSLLRCQEEGRQVRVAHVVEKSHPSYRLAWFYFQGINEVKTSLSRLKIPLDLLPDTNLQSYLEEVQASGMVADLNSLREFDLKPVLDVCEKRGIPLWEVDSHNVVPVWEASDKQEYAARTIRIKINKILGDYLLDIPPTASNSHTLKEYSGSVNIDGLLEKRWGSDVKVNIKQTPGEKAGREALSKFLSRMSAYEKDRNDPTKNGISGLSPWFRHGHLSKQRAAFEAKKNSASSASFIEELVIRGELAENYTFYNKHYDTMEGAPNFGKITLENHKKDKREHVYTYEQLKSSKTYDPLWNAAQNELVKDGKMHGFMRMYWAKKILEWTATPQQALEFAIKLNDDYSLDGRDPRGYVGVMWSITGLHDQGWRERPIFGKVRYMNFAGCKRKFDVEEYIRKHK